MTRVMFYQGCWQRIKFQYLIRGVGKKFCFREKEKEKEKEKKKKKKKGEEEEEEEEGRRIIICFLLN
jgi:hypothetical protein